MQRKGVERVWVRIKRLGKKWEEWERQGNRKVVKGSRKGMGEHR